MGKVKKAQAKREPKAEDAPAAAGAVAVAEPPKAEKETEDEDEASHSCVTCGDLSAIEDDPERLCTTCNKFVCRDCNDEIDGAPYCAACWVKKFKEIEDAKAARWDAEMGKPASAKPPAAKPADTKAKPAPVAETPTARPLPAQGFVVQAGRLWAALDRCVAYAARTRIRPALACIRMHLTGGEVLLEATDLEIWCRIRVEGVRCLKQADTALLPHLETLAGIVRGLDAEETLSVHCAAGLTIACPSGKFDVACYPKLADWPEFQPFKEQGQEVGVNARALAQGLASVRFAASETMQRFAINCVHLRTNKGLWLEATNGSTLLATDCVACEGSFNPQPCGPMLPLRFVAALTAHLAEEGAESFALLRWDGRRLVVNVGGSVYSTLLVEGTYPKLQQVLDLAQNPLHEFADLDPANLRNAVRLAAMMCSKDSFGVKIEFKAKGTQVRAANAEKGSAAVAWPGGDGMPEEVTADFNFQPLAQALEKIGAEKINMALYPFDKTYQLLMTTGKRKVLVNGLVRGKE